MRHIKKSAPIGEKRSRGPYQFVSLSYEPCKRNDMIPPQVIRKVSVFWRITWVVWFQICERSRNSDSEYLYPTIRNSRFPDHELKVYNPGFDSSPKGGNLNFWNWVLVILSYQGRSLGKVISLGRKVVKI